MAGNPFLALVALVLVAGGLLLNIFVILSGTFINVAPINKIFFLSAATQGMGADAPATSTWTYFSLCTLSGTQNSACGKIHPAFPFDPVSNFGGSQGVPSAFIGSHFYYYMSRVSWSFYLIASFFAALTLFSGIFACCARIAGFLSGFNAFTAALMQAVCAALMTAWTIKARAAFRAAGHASDLGRYAYGFTWASFVCFFVAMILFCSSGGRKKKTTNEEEELAGPVDPATHEPVPHQQVNTGYNYTTNSKSRETGVKDEYS